MYSDWAVSAEDNDNNRGQNIPSWRGQRLIQVQLIYSLPFVTTMKKRKNTTTTKKKILDRIFNAIGPGLPRKNCLKIDADAYSKYQIMSIGRTARFREIYDRKTFHTTFLSMRTSGNTQSLVCVRITTACTVGQSRSQRLRDICARVIACVTTARKEIHFYSKL